MHFSLDKTEKYVVIKLHEQKLNTLIAAELKSELLLLNTQGFNNIILDLEESLLRFVGFKCHFGWKSSMPQLQRIVCDYGVKRYRYEISSDFTARSSLEFSPYGKRCDRFYQ